VLCQHCHCHFLRGGGDPHSVSSDL
jgi:hypothetical protein